MRGVMMVLVVFLIAGCQQVNPDAVHEDYKEHVSTLITVIESMESTGASESTDGLFEMFTGVDEINDRELNEKELALKEKTIALYEHVAGVSNMEDYGQTLQAVKNQIE